MTDEKQQERNEPQESELEELAKHFLETGRESGLSAEADYDLQFVDNRFTYWTYLRYESSNNSFILSLDRDYDVDLNLIDPPIKDTYTEGFVDLPLNDDILEALENKDTPKEKIKNSLVDLLPEPSLDSLGISLKVFNQNTGWETIFEVGFGHMYCGENIGLLDADFRENFLLKYKNKPKEEALRIYEEIWERVYLPILKKYGNKMAEINSSENPRDLIKKAIDLGFEICKDSELEKIL